MNANTFLIPVSLEGESFWLPCRGQGLLALAMLRLSDKQIDKDDLGMLLVEHPTLLIAALSHFPVSEVVKQSMLLEWVQAFSLTPELRNFKETKFKKEKFWRRIAKSTTSEQLYKKLQRHIRSVSEGKVGLSRSLMPQVSKGLLRLLSKSAKRLLEGNRTDSVSMLPGVLAEVQSAWAIKSNFEAELQRRKLESMRLLAYGASHEINNPLANVATRAQSLIQSEGDPKRRHRLAVIYEQAMRAHEMISDMMLFAHPPALVTGPVSLMECVNQVANEFAAKLEKENIRLVVSGEAPALLGDQSKLCTAIKSLLANSIEAIGQNGRIEVELGNHETGGHWISISDDGPGVDPEIGQNVFDPFFSGREAGRGLGFGLSKAWRILQMHEAKIDYSSSTLGGAKFLVEFPNQAESLVDFEQHKSQAA
jgi:signal transduction histidine kinase